MPSADTYEDVVVSIIIKQSKMDEKYDTDSNPHDEHDY
jgi:hypothetical protein